jgi:hypothetical protein
MSGFLPGAESGLDSLADGGHCYPIRSEFGGGHHAVAAGSFGGFGHEIGFVGEEAVVFFADAGIKNEVNDFAGGDVAGVGDVVDAVGDVFFPAGEGGGNEFVELRDGVGRLQQALVAHELGEVVARAIAVVEGDAEAPDINVRGASEDFFAEGFGAGVEGAVVLAEGEVRGVGLVEAGAVRAGSGVDAAGRDVAPGNAGGGAGFSDAAGEDCVAEEAVGFVELTGVDIGLTGVASGVDEEGDLVGAQGGGEGGRGGVVELGAGDRLKWQAFVGEEGLIGLADVARAAEKVNHRRLCEGERLTGQIQEGYGRFLLV